MKSPSLFNARIVFNPFNVDVRCCITGDLQTPIKTIKINNSFI